MCSYFVLKFFGCDRDHTGKHLEMCVHLVVVVVIVSSSSISVMHWINRCRNITAYCEFVSFVIDWPDQKMPGNLKANSECMTAPSNARRRSILRQAVLQREICMNSKTLIAGTEKHKSTLPEFLRDFQNRWTTTCGRSLNLELVGLTLCMLSGGQWNTTFKLEAFRWIRGTGRSRMCYD